MRVLWRDEGGGESDCFVVFAVRWITEKEHQQLMAETSCGRRIARADVRNRFTSHCQCEQSVEFTVNCVTLQEEGERYEYGHNCSKSGWTK
jgi:hypothetical protein